MSPNPIPYIITLITVATTISRFAAGDGGGGNLSAYQVIQQYGFPVGILPEGVAGYKIMRDTGEFSVSWGKTCSFSLEGSYSLSYKSTISGVVSNGRLWNLKGVTVKVLFFWLNIVEVVVDGGDLQFSVGIASASFPVDNFLESPRCGCGFDCVGLNERSDSSLLSS